MRIKQLWRHCDIPAKASLVWSRITFSRLTTTYFIVAVLHCFVQVITQARAFSINAAAAQRLWALVQHSNQTKEANGFAIFAGDLRICYTVPNTIDTDSCIVIWDSNNQSSTSAGMAAAFPVSIASTPISITSTPTSIANESFPTTTLALNESLPSAIPVASQSLYTVAPTASVNSVPTLSISPASRTSAATESLIPSSSSWRSVPSPSLIPVVISPTSEGRTQNLIEGNDDGGSIPLDRRTPSRRLATDKDFELNLTCVQTLIWPVQRLSDTKREDITLIGFQVWVLGMSIVALLNESILHICAALVTQLLVTIWTLFQVSQTEQFRLSFARLTTNGACHGTNLLGTYWEDRKIAETLSAVLNGVGFFVTAVLTYKLIKIYGWQTFKRVGASLTINRIYKLVLSLSIALQLALFFIVFAAALWIDQLYNGSVGRLATLGPLYKGGIILIFSLLIPWLSLGWFAVRREARTLALVFLVLSLLFMGLWAALFGSTSFRWTFMLWPFFAVMTVTAGTLMVITFILGVACRFNFGKGLPRYLNAEEPLEGENFQPVFPEKWGLSEDPEKVDFPHGHPVPTFSATFGKGPQVPRPTRMQFGRLREQSITRSGSFSSKDAHIMRTNSQISHDSNSSTSSRRTDMGKRWVIE